MIATRDAEAKRPDIDLRSFIDSIPSADAIRDRLNRNSCETKVLKKLLRLAVAAENERAGREGAAR